MQTPRISALTPPSRSPRKDLCRLLFASSWTSAELCRSLLRNWPGARSGMHPRSLGSALQPPLSRSSTKGTASQAPKRRRPAVGRVGCSLSMFALLVASCIGVLRVENAGEFEMWNQLSLRRRGGAARPKVGPPHTWPSPILSAICSMSTTTQHVDERSRTTNRRDSLDNAVRGAGVRESSRLRRVPVVMYKKYCGAAP